MSNQKIASHTSFYAQRPMVNTTGHRGMGVLSTPRHHFLPGEIFFPENSIAAFKEALRLKADAVECDIHVSKDHQAIVIHGDKTYEYGDYLMPEALCPEEKTKKKLAVSALTTEELQESFALKSHDPITIGTSEVLFDQLPFADRTELPDPHKQTICTTKRSWLRDNPDRYQIPTLRQLLILIYKENIRRQADSIPFALLNIELKGKGSAIASLAAILEFYNMHPDAKTYLPPEALVFLGKRDVGEICIANALLKGHLDLGVNELREQFLREHYNELVAEYQTSMALLTQILLVCQKYQLKAKDPMTGTLLILAC